MDTSKYKDLFVSETREHLTNLNRSLLALEKSPNDPALVNEIFRSVHTVKGMAASINQEMIAEISHRAEDLLDRMRKRQVAAGPEQVEAVFKFVDFLEAAVAMVALDKSPEAELGDVSRGLLARFEGLATAAAAASAAAAPAPAAGAEYDFSRINPLKERDSLVFRIRILLEKDIPLKSARAFLMLRALEGAGKIAYTVPERFDIEAERFDRGFTVIFVTRLREGKAIADLVTCSEVEDVEIREIAEETREQSLESRTIGAFVQIAQEKPKDVKVSVVRLDRLMNMVGELVVWKERLRQLAAGSGRPLLVDGVDEVARIVGDLQHEVLASRLVAMAEVFDRFPRVVRDAAKALGKEIAFEVQGRELEMDRSILQLLAEPLVHLLRNAVDHGVETPDERAAAGKPRAGTITVTAVKLKEQALITVRDDGRGMDVEAIRRKAVEKGLVAAEAAAALSDAQVIEFTGRPGFSTAARVTEVSGRGVGMDVVKNKITALGGQLSVDSRAGRGCTFTLAIPLSLSIIHTLLVAADRMTYAMPLSQVKETINVQPAAVRTLQGTPVLLYRDRAIPLLHLAALLGRGGERQLAGPAVVVENQGAEMALVIDRMLGQQEIVVKPLARMLRETRLFSGATISREGRPMLILDINNLAA
ncbi:MAG: chemotaxis protein CheA [Candidatus Edwardsbacteria bacterium]|jgi:two-component system chemotaxis sensor kinase CheA|nr:chemotaxis protein CheA [Candidatus Edwardsbacteria bacterium]